MLLKSLLCLVLSATACRLGKDHANLGTPGQLFGRDVEPPTFANGYNTPRKGPDARLVSNMFCELFELTR